SSASPHLCIPHEQASSSTELSGFYQCEPRPVTGQPLDGFRSTSRAKAPVDAHNHEIADRFAAELLLRYRPIRSRMSTVLRQKQGFVAHGPVERLWLTPRSVCIPDGEARDLSI